MQKAPQDGASGYKSCCALGGTRTPNLLIRSQMLYPLSYKRWVPCGNLVSLAEFGWCLKPLFFR
jgi:hypothetical protein